LHRTADALITRAAVREFYIRIFESSKKFLAKFF